MCEIKTKQFNEDLLEKRVIHLNGDIAESDAKRISTAILWLNVKNENEPITLYLESQGGGVLSGLDIYDIVRHSKAPVIGIVRRRANSMAAVILQACTIRKAYEHSDILIHNVQVRKDLGKLLKGNLEKELEESIKNQESIIEILAWRTKQPVDLIRQKCDEEKSMSPEEARTFGLIDEVICFKPLNEYQNAVLVS